MTPHRSFHRSWRAALVALALLGASAPVAAAEPTWSTAASVPDAAGDAAPATGRRAAIDVALDRSGNAWTVWVQTDETSSTTTDPAQYRLRVARRPAGGAWEVPVDVATGTRAAGGEIGSMVSPRIAVDAAGAPTVAWVVYGGATAEAFASTRATGGTWSAPVSLGTSTTGNTALTRLELQIFPSGDSAVAWQGTDGVRLAWRAAGGAWQAAETVSADTVTYPDHVGLGRAVDGTVTALWRTNDAVKTRRRSTGGTWDTAVTVSSVTGAVRNPELAVDSLGSAVAVWASATGARAAVRAAGESGAWAAPVELSTGSSEAPASTHEGIAGNRGKGAADVDFDGHGNATVVWVENATPRVMARTLSSAGVWSDPVVVAPGTTQTPPRAPTVEVGDDGQATLLWVPLITVVPAPGGGTMSVGGQVMESTRDTADGAWSAPQTLAGTWSAIAGELTGRAALATDELGNALIGWTDARTSIYGNAPAALTASTVSGERAGLPRADWTARGVGSSLSLRSWVNYLYGGEGVLLSDGAVPLDAGDRYSWRLTPTDAWIDGPTGTVVGQYQGTIAWSFSSHSIDIRIRNPRIEVVPGATKATLVADGQSSGSMADALSGHGGSIPFTGKRLLSLSLAAAPRVGADGSQTWIAAPATLTSEGVQTLALDAYADRPFGHVTFAVPGGLPTHQPPGDEDDGDGPSDPGAGGGSSSTTTTPAAPTTTATPAPGKPATTAKAAAKVTTASGKLSGKAARTGTRTATVTLGRQLGRSAKKSYRVVLRSKGKVIATGTLRGRTLKLVVKGTKRKGAATRYPRLKGSYALAAAPKVTGVTKATIRIG